jgi:putative acetyltransferase
MSPAITIRRERADRPDVTALLASLDAYLESLYPPDANHILDVAALLEPAVRFHVARRGERAVGTGAVRLMDGEPATGGEPYGEIKRMYVDPAERGQRIGEQLLQVLEDTLRAEGVGLALLETGAEQTAAVKLYERCGYRPRGAYGGYPDNGLSVFYAKRL